MKLYFTKIMFAKTVKPIQYFATQIQKHNENHEPEINNIYFRTWVCVNPPKNTAVEFT